MNKKKPSPRSRVQQARLRLKLAIGDYRFATGDGHAVLARLAVEEAIDAYAKAIRKEGRSK